METTYEHQTPNALQTTLRAYLAERQAKNPNYSLRSFARGIGMSPALLSQLMSGQRRLTKKSAEKIIAGMDLSALQCKSLIAMVPTTRSGASTKTAVTRLSGDEFSVVSDWHHYAILGLAAIPDNKSEPKWIAEKLGITVGQAKEAFTRLQNLDFIELHEDGFVQSVAPLDTVNGVPSAAIRKYHRQTLEKAIQSLVSDPVEERFFHSLTVAIDPDDLPQLENVIRQFKQRFDKKCESKKKRRVYQLAMQFFPLDKKESV